MLVLLGAVLTGRATFFYGMVFFRDGWSPGLTTRDLAVGLATVGAITGALVGLLLIRLTASPVGRRSRPLLIGLLGVVAGLVPCLVYGVFLEEVCIPSDAPDCGWSVFGWMTGSGELALGLIAALGMVLGVSGAFVAARLTRATPMQPASAR
jgi:hypothetical protein